MMMEGSKKSHLLIFGLRVEERGQVINLNFLDVINQSPEHIHTHSYTQKDRAKQETSQNSKKSLRFTINWSWNSL